MEQNYQIFFARPQSKLHLQIPTRGVFSELLATIVGSSPPRETFGGRGCLRVVNSGNLPKPSQWQPLEVLPGERSPSYHDSIQETTYLGFHNLILAWGRVANQRLPCNHHSSESHGCQIKLKNTQSCSRITTKQFI